MGILYTEQTETQTSPLSALKEFKDSAISTIESTIKGIASAIIRRQILDLIQRGVEKKSIPSKRDKRKKVVLITDFNEPLPQTECRWRLNQFGIRGDEIDDSISTVEPFNITNAAFHANQAVEALSSGDVIELVVDPGVGNGEKNDRRIIVRTKQGIFLVGPNNGGFGLLDVDEAWEIDFDKLKNLGIYDRNAAQHTTFHGRDVFAPVAAICSHITSLTSDPEIQSQILSTTIAKPLSIEQLHRLEIQKGEVLHSDPYGNLKLNLSIQEEGISIGEEIEVEVIQTETNGLAFRVLNGDKTTPQTRRIKAKVVKSFAEASFGEFVIYDGSSKLPNRSTPAAEIAVVRGNALKVILERIM